MKKSLGSALADLSLQDEDDYWDEEAEFDGSACYEHDASAKPADDDGSGGHAPDGSADLEEVCAICLNAIEPENLAIIKGCEHEYCVNCILQWAMCKEAPWCPQCKKPFNYLYCYRLLDGTMSDAPVEESVCLLKRASWFVEHVKTLEKGKAVSASMAAEEIPPEWNDPYQYYDYDDDDYDEDEQIEKYYFSSAAGPARVVLGNRRLGENGYMRAGRMYARPTNNNGGQAGGMGSGGIGKAGKGRTPGGKACGSGGGGAAGAAAGSSSNSSVAGGSRAGPSSTASVGASGSAAKGQGRRAKRNARRAAADLEDDY